MIEIKSSTARDMLAFVREAQRYEPLRRDADDLIERLTDALERDGSPDQPASIAAELLEAIGQASGRTLSTIPSLHSLRSAREALAEVGPVLGSPAKVFDLPRAVTPDTKRDIAAEVARQIEQAGGVDVSILDFDHTDRGTHRYPARPMRGEVIELPGGDLRRVATVSVRCGHVAVRLEPIADPRGEIYTGTG